MKILKCKHIIIIIALAFSSASLSGQDNYFWIGGTGNWSDLSHWATSSGGNILHLEVPAGEDNVIFDQNSFSDSMQVVTINVGNPVCNNMSWTDVKYRPTVFGVDTINLRVFGDLKLDTGMVQGFLGTVSFEATQTGKTIFSAGHQYWNDVFFNGQGGGWTLLDSLKVLDEDPFIYRNIYLNKGSLDANSQKIVCEGFSSLNTNTRFLDITNSLMEIYGNWNIIADNFTLSAIPSLIRATEFVINNNGDDLTFHNIEFTGLFGGFLNSNVHSYNNIIEFKASGIVEGGLHADTILFNTDGAGMDSCLMGGKHNVNYIEMMMVGRIKGDTSYYKKIVFDMFGKFTGTGNDVDTLIIKGPGLVTGINNIDYLYFTTKGTMDGTNYIDKAVFAADGKIWGMNTFKDLLLSAGFFYELENDSVQTVLNNIELLGVCEGSVMITSDVNSAQAILYKEGPALDLDWLILRDIKADGPNTPFIANNSVDLGNNSNWTFQNTNARDLYWVGGTGNWKDYNHWSLSSGGAPGECPPTPLDNVYFDGNSFFGPNQAVTLNVKYGTCNDMDWTGASNTPSFNGPDTNNVRIWGSLEFIEDMDMGFGGHFFFEATETGKTIDMAEKEAGKNVVFQGRNGGWTLQDALIATDTINFILGSLFTDGQAVQCNNFYSVDTTTRTLVLDTTTVTVLQQQSDAWHIMGINLTFDGSKSLIRATGAMDGNVRSDASANLVYNDIEIYGYRSRLKNYAICHYNLVQFFNDENISEGDCTMDTVIYWGSFGSLLASDSINAAIFMGYADTIVGGFHVIKAAHFYNDGWVTGLNKIDTLFFHANGNIKLVNTIGICTFNGNGEIFGRNSFGTLNLTPTKKYWFESDSTQTIINELNAMGSCTGTIFLQSDRNGFQAKLKKINGNVLCEYVSLRDISALGTGITFTANNSVDLGNNTGWTINQAAPLGLYWVNGTGNWDDPMHWAAYSGGPGNFCLPKEIDNVYFDENSFLADGDTVNINIDNAVCKSMYWTGSDEFNPMFRAPVTSSLIIYGSMFLNDSVNLQLAGPVYFDELAAEINNDYDTINSFGKPFFNNLTFFGIGDHCLLTDDLITFSDVNLIHGELKTGDNLLQCSRFSSDTTTLRLLDMEDSEFSLNRLNNDGWVVNADNLTIKSDNSTINLNMFGCNMKTSDGDFVKLNNVRANAPNIGIFNYGNQVGYNVVEFNDLLGLMKGNYIIDTVRFYGDYGSIKDHSVTNHAYFYSKECSIDGNHLIDTAIFYAYGFINNSNLIHDCRFIADGKIFGTNTFHNLTFSPGGTYELQSNKTQTVTDTLKIRGNNCFGITLRSTAQGTQALITKPDGIVAGDFIEIRDINATGGATYYAGEMSEDLGNNTGWLFENAPGYIFGFGSDTLRFCLGTDFYITTENFNGTASTRYYWGNPPEMGESSLLVTEPGVYDLIVVYGTGSDSCSIVDQVTVEADMPALALMEEGPFCEGDTISLTVSPTGDYYLYKWFDNSTDSVYTANLLNQGILWAEITDTLTGCVTHVEQNIEVTETPKPEIYLGNDTIIKYGYFINLDAGPGTSWSWWCEDPLITIDTPEEQVILARGMQDGVTYNVDVENNGCKASGSIVVDEFPRCAADVPNAFTPNGDTKNDVVYVKCGGLSDLTFMIFNRYGDLIFQTTNQEEGWDGTSNGVKQEPDVYTYYMHAVCEDGGLVEKKGNITLIR